MPEHCDECGDCVIPTWLMVLVLVNAFLSAAAIFFLFWPSQTWPLSGSVAVVDTVPRIQ